MIDAMEDIIIDRDRGNCWTSISWLLSTNKKREDKDEMINPTFNKVWNNKGFSQLESSTNQKIRIPGSEKNRVNTTERKNQTGQRLNSVANNDIQVALIKALSNAANTQIVNVENIDLKNFIN